MFFLVKKHFFYILQNENSSFAFMNGQKYLTLHADYQKIIWRKIEWVPMKNFHSIMA